MGCPECHCIPHLPGCPNAPEPIPVHTCKRCKDGIYVGDEFFDIDGTYYHTECLEDMTIYDVLDMFGYSCEVAEEPEVEYEF